MKFSTVVFVISVVLALSPFIVPVYPTQDGPSHLNTIEAVQQIRDGRTVNTAVYQEVSAGYSNSIAPFVLEKLTHVASPARSEWAMALLITISTILTVVLASSLMKRSVVNGVYALSLGATTMLYMGSISLALGYAAAYASLVMAAWYLSTSARTALLAMVALALIAFVIQAQLIVGLLAAIMGGAFGAGLLKVVRLRSVAVARPYLVLALACLPLVAILLIYQASFSSQVVGGGVYWSPFEGLKAIVTRRELIHFSPLDMAMQFILFALTTVAVGFWVVRRLRAGERTFVGGAEDWAFAAALSLFAFVLVLPVSTSAIPQIPERLLPLAHFCLYVWFLAAAPQIRLRSAILAVAFLTTAVSGISRTLGHLSIEEEMRGARYVEERVPSGAVVMPFDIRTITDRPEHLGSSNWNIAYRPLLHHGRFFRNADIVSLDNYQAQASVPFFRIRYRNSWDELHPVSEPNLIVQGHPDAQALLDWTTDFAATFGHPVSHVILREDGLAKPEPASSGSASAAVRQFVSDNFSPVTSDATSDYSLWVRKPSVPPESRSSPSAEVELE